MITRLVMFVLLLVAAVISFQPSPSQADESELCAQLSHVGSANC